MTPSADDIRKALITVARQSLREDRHCFAPIVERLEAELAAAETAQGAQDRAAAILGRLGAA